MNKGIRLVVFLLIWMSSLGLTAQDKTVEQLALQYYNNGEFEKAAELYSDLFKKTPNTYYYTYYLNSLLESGNYRDAERFVKGLKPTRELRRNFSVELGYVYQLQGDSKKAEKEYERAIDKMGTGRVAVVDVANAFLIRRLPDYAVKAYQKGRDNDPQGYPYHMELANVYQSARNFGGMMDEYLDLVGADESRIDHVQNILQALMNSYNDESFNQVLRSKMLERSRRYPDKIIYSELLLWYSIQQKEFSLALMQAKAMEKRTRDEGDAVYRVGQLAASNEFYDVAIDAFEYIKAKGENHFLYMSAEVLLLEVKFSQLMRTGMLDKDKILEMAGEYEKVIADRGKLPNTIVLIRNLAHLKAFYLDHSDEAVKLLEEAIAMRGISAQIIAQCKTDLADILLMEGDEWEAALLYMQVEKAFKYDLVGFEAKLKNARLSFYIGEFEWAKTQLDVLRSATSKLIANDAMELSLLIADNMEDVDNTLPLAMYAKADLLVFRKKPEEALSILDSLTQMFPFHNIQDEVLLKKAEIMIAKRQYEDADSLLNRLLSHYGDDILADNALIMQARMHDYQLKNSQRAMELYENLIIDYPGSIFTAEARKRFRELRGDNITG